MKILRRGKASLKLPKEACRAQRVAWARATRKLSRTRMSTKRERRKIRFPPTINTQFQRVTGGNSELRPPQLFIPELQLADSRTNRRACHSEPQCRVLSSVQGPLASVQSP
ncbi:hypothetical protein JZ751_015413 [Albula glossodonta]|uniref:Uncharacterized protein n=1 Tax=Albula glossodonta TaxID=121402 RepID=A0A8T2N1N6_9TELE|nr:hypothetical protein JZ751_015413 [Albula glossodonta]